MKNNFCLRKHPIKNLFLCIAWRFVNLTLISNLFPIGFVFFLQNCMFSPVHPVLIDNFKGLKYQLRYFKIYLIDLYIDILKQNSKSKNCPISIFFSSEYHIELHFTYNISYYGNIKPMNMKGTNIICAISLTTCAGFQGNFSFHLETS